MDTTQLLCAIAAEAALVLGAASSLRRSSWSSMKLAEPTETDESEDDKGCQHLQRSIGELFPQGESVHRVLERLHGLGCDPLKQCDFAVEMGRQQPYPKEWLDRQKQNLSQYGRTTFTAPTTKRRRVEDIPQRQHETL
ncbi:MAG: uncharacterized protein KVP18_000411 [Porospora cf. gigantea A]|uniref:uncharacterized protein n=1 Tax=Porospora cf. gigantea A TaxID=2853593 RepID=UPI00355AB054|nr:MAG: hypothetical protein KVP18_000411 [Porospora cf. gigantea A]